MTLKWPDAARAADEAKFAQQILCGSLLAIEVAAKPLYKAYTPFCAATDADAAAGNLG